MEMDARELRNTLGNFTTGVCLITAHDAQGEAMALTANSFSSVSLEPPLVLWSLQNSSDVFEVFAGPSRYAINVLTSDQEGLSVAYARPGEHQLDPAHYELGDNGAPVVRDALAVFECTLEATYEGGDHTIIVGRVSRFAAQLEREPLVFYRGGYCALAAS